MKLFPATLLTLTLTAAAPAFAADQGMKDMPGMQGMGGHMIMGMHEMPATVSTIDAASGRVDVDAEGMKLKLHFPPASLVGVKAGDKITLHLGFTKP